MAELLINSQNFKYNLNLITQHLDCQDNLALVLKDNAYGHGLREIAGLARESGIESVFVKNEAEALQIKNHFKHITAFYGEISPQSPSNIYQCIHSLQTLQEISPLRPFELEVNCGMNRNGIPMHSLSNAFEIIAKRGLKLIGVFTHNGFGDEGGEEFLLQEGNTKKVRNEVISLCTHHNLPLPRFHSLNTSGVLRGSGVREIVRVGIGAYGYACDSLNLHSLKPIASLWADKICSHSLKKGEKIGYGGIYEMPYDGVVSSYDLGYGDGLFRINERSKGKLLCSNGEQILPRMSMDCFSALSKEDKICVFNDVREWAKFFDTIPYEILTKLSPFIKRKVI